MTVSMPGDARDTGERRHAEPSHLGRDQLPLPITARPLDEPWGAEQAHLWVVRVSEQAANRTRDTDLLDAEERRRAAKFLRAADSDRYRVAHAGLRRLLGAYLDTDPAAVEMTCEDCPGCGGPHGRPAVVGLPLHFSLSHAGDLVLFSFASLPTGVDVEAAPAATSLPDLVRALHPDERAELEGLPAAERPMAFARCWTRKEAYLKGVGIGLGEDPASVLTGAGPEPVALADWTMTDVSVADGYAAACSVRRAPGSKRA